jgi:hypothetical protein
LEDQQLIKPRLRQSRHRCDTVADLNHSTDVLKPRLELHGADASPTLVDPST